MENNNTPYKDLSPDEAQELATVARKFIVKNSKSKSYDPKFITDMPVKHVVGQKYAPHVSRGIIFVGASWDYKKYNKKFRSSIRHSFVKTIINKITSLIHPY